MYHTACQILLISSCSLIISSSSKPEVAENSNGILLNCSIEISKLSSGWFCLVLLILKLSPLILIPLVVLKLINLDLTSLRKFSSDRIWSETWIKLFRDFSVSSFKVYHCNIK